MSMQEVIDRAIADPEFGKRLKGDFMGAAREAGIEVTPDEIKAHLGMQHASDEEAVEAMQSRVSMAGAMSVM
jgi:hypothetical protein